MNEHLDLAHIDKTIPRLALRSKDAAMALGISERLLWDKTNSGEIPHCRIGGAKVYPVETLSAYLLGLLQNQRPTKVTNPSQNGATHVE
jgi:Helix-turn-helix domain